MNPLKELREANGWTQESFADKVGCSKQLVVRAEQGCYPEPPPVIMDYLKYHPRANPFDTAVFLAKYRDFQREVRVSSYGKLNGDYPFLLEFDLETDEPKHPFVAWRELSSLNATQVAKYYCLHPALIYKFEKQHYLMNSLPNPLVDALMESGYGPAVLDRLEQAFLKFKSAKSDRIEVSVAQQRGNQATGPDRAGLLPN